MNPSAQEEIQSDPRWPAAVAIAAVALLNMVLPEPLSAGPFWLLLVIVGLLAIPLTLTHWLGRHGLNQKLGLATLSVVTAFLVYSVGALIRAMIEHRETPAKLLVSAAILWFSNILVFASWYWRLDAGGPHQRELRGSHTEGAFLFPQMTQGDADWIPGFVDYLFLAFNTSTAFSPTDAPVLSRWAKGMMMVQSAISFSTVALLAARAVNIL